MAMRRVAMAAAAALVLGLGACGDDDDAGGDAGTEIEDGASTDAGGDTGGDTAGDDGAAAASDLPDPCGLFDEEELTDAFGAPGEGTGGSVDPTRRVCTYAAGAIVGVGTANQYEPAVNAAKAAGAACDDVDGVGDRASFCTSFGQVGQLLWVEGALVYDVTALSTERDDFTGLAGSLGG